MQFITFRDIAGKGGDILNSEYNEYEKIKSLCPMNHGEYLQISLNIVNIKNEYSKKRLNILNSEYFLQFMNIYFTIHEYSNKYLFSVIHEYS